jgi:hypothetical protein
MKPEEAERILVRGAGIRDGALDGMLLRDRVIAQRIYREAAKLTHPDAGGTAADFQSVASAHEVLERHFQGLADGA